MKIQPNGKGRIQIGSLWNYSRQIFAQNSSVIYHGTTTGINNSILNSFRNGINPQYGTGQGQGQGFFCYLDINSAKSTAIKVADPSDAAVSEGNHGGFPMVVSAIVPMNQIEPDYEKNVDHLIKIIQKHWNEFVSIPQIPSEYGVVYPSKSMQHDQGIVLAVNNKRMGFTVDSGGGLVRGGQVISAIIKAMVAQNQQITNEFTDLMIPGKAVKYIGPSVPSSGIIAFVNNAWIDVSNQNPPQQNVLNVPNSSQQPNVQNPQLV